MAILLLLQAHGQMTAGELAERLEASERTIRRDLEALCVAGVPLYARRGRGGGWNVLGGNRFDLSGLTAAEARALFLATGPSSVATFGPGVAEGLAAARHKMLAALPSPLRAEVEAAGTALLVDASRWGPASGRPGGPVAGGSGEAHLDTLRSAVLEGLQVDVDYAPPGRPAARRRLHPHGLVCKRGVWYLLATAPAGLRTYRLSRVRAVGVTDEPAVRPLDFDLATAWAEVQRRLAERVADPVVVDLLAEPSGLGRLRATVGAWWELDERGEVEGRMALTIAFPSPGLAAAELAAHAGQVEVVGPSEVRAELAAIGRRLVGRYG